MNRRLQLPLLATPALLLLALAACAGCGLAAQGRNVDGVRYFQQGNYPAAINRFQLATQADPQDPNGYYNWAAVLHKQYLQTRDPAVLNQAQGLYQQALAIDGNHLDARRGFAVLLSDSGRTQDAFTMLRTWAAQNPRSAEPRVELAKLSQEVGDNQTASFYLNEGLQIDPGNWRVFAGLGLLREREGNYRQAYENYLRAYQLNTTKVDLVAKLNDLQIRAAGGTGAPLATAPVNASAGAYPGGYSYGAGAISAPPGYNPGLYSPGPQSLLGNGGFFTPNLSGSRTASSPRGLQY